MAQAEQLGDWIVVLRSDVRINDVETVLEGLIRAGTAIRPGNYGSRDLLAMSQEEAQALVQLHRNLTDLHIIDVVQVGTEPHQVRYMGFSADVRITGFSDPLESTIQANAFKLGQARPRETHLAVLVYDYPASRFASQTPPPILPDEIDFLWIIHMHPDIEGRITTWMVGRGSTAWTESALPPEVLQDGSARPPGNG